MAERYVEPGWILVTCSGTVGDTLIAYSVHNTLIVSHDLLRVQPNDSQLAGYIYTFLRTRYGRALMRSTKYGNVIKHMEPEHLQELAVPMLGDPQLKSELASTVIEVYRMRDEAYALERAAEKEFSDAIGAIPEGSLDEPTIVSAAEVFPRRRRLDGYHYNAIVRSILRVFAKAGKTTTELSVLAPKIILPNRMRRGVPLSAEIPFLDMEELFKVNPAIDKFLPKSMAKQLSDYYVQGGWLLLSRSGQTYGLHGSVVLANEWHEGKAVAEHAIRIVPKEGVRAGFLCAVMSHPQFGRPLVLRHSFGTSVPEIDPRDIGTFPVVRLGRELEDSLADKMERASVLRMKAKKQEDGAVRLLEKRIDEQLEKAGVKAVEGAEGGPVKVNLPFDEAIRRAMKVTPPPGGWKALDESAIHPPKKRRRASR